jgi:hypothetical protein
MDMVWTKGLKWLWKEEMASGHAMYKIEHG